MLDFLKGKKIYSILTGTCPVCQQESMYVKSNPYRLGRLFKMHNHCSHCGTTYKIEPSFFFGAMYVSYAIGTAFAFAAFIISHYFIAMRLWPSFIVVIVILVVFFPIIARLSRNIWINFFLNFKGEDYKQ